MGENCRVCCETTQGTNAKNLFDSEQSVFLHHIELLTGEWLTYEENSPTYICICCEQDLKVAAAFRERCIKTQRKLRNDSICASPTSEIFDEIKMENSVDESDEYSEADQGTNDFDADFELECVGEEQEDEDIKYSIDGDEEFGEFDTDEDEEFSIKQLDIKEEDSQSIEDDNELEAQRVADKFKISSTKQSADSPDRTSPEPTLQIPPPIKRRKFINWRVLTEEQVKEMKRLVRRRDCVCDQCGRHFNDPSNLKLHLIRHAGVKNFTCEDCGSKFYTAHLLKRHKLIHSEVPLFSCDYCDRTFNYSKSKIEHERIHRNEKPYKCDHCEKYFRTTGKRRDHQVVHTGLRRFHCETCDKWFLARKNLVAHFKSKFHNEQVQTQAS